MLGFLTRKNPPAAPLGEVAARSTAGRIQYYIGELPPDPRDRATYADSYRDDSQALLLYRDTLRDERAMAALDQRLHAAVSRPWEVEPGGEREIDRTAAAHLEGQLRGLDFDSICRQLLHGVWYGYAVAEAIWARSGNSVIIKDLKVRAPDRFRWSVDNELLLRTDTALFGEPVPDAKFGVLTRPGESVDVPHGPGLARWCYWPVWFKRNGIGWWATSIEKFGSPTSVGKYPRTATEGEKKTLLELVYAFTSGAAVALPEDQAIEIIEGGRRTLGLGGDFSAFVRYLDVSMTTTILGQSSTTDQGPWRGTADVQKDVRDETVAADARLLGEALNSSIARWLTAWNFPGAAPPRIRRDVEPPEDLDARAKREETLGRMSGLRPTRAHIERVYGGEWEDAPEPSGTGPGMPDGTPGNSPRGDLAEPGEQRHDAIGTAIEDLIGEGWEPLMDPVIEPLLAEASAALERGESLEAFRGGLPAVFDAMDDAVLVQTLRRMGFSARLSGGAGLEGAR
ncbi:MAG: DUF935 family protein [Rhodospirillales bacterium]|nr:DUF935 family protein [Rhodospirillales bacterium]